mmetsp:Transcript_56205/g.91017  ORF Transcript_56205/g.91017 Transcript_56205/m.91017 type:complete len:334 (+) Transcript_56205:148-1149(+)
MVRNSNRRQEEESGSPHGARRVSARHWRPTLALAVCIASVGWAPQSVHAQRGYDREENPTGIWQGYCLPLPFNQAVGLCAGYTGAPKVCAASISGENTKSAEYWFDQEIFNERAPHTDKSLVKGTQSFEALQMYIVNWACKQIGENVRQRSTLSPDEKQEAACNFVWRRDQEIQSDALFSVPANGYSWGTFIYKPPGKNLSTFVFKGSPKQQCSHDYECRGLNSPGDVYTSCDYCENYFNLYCDVKPHAVFKFCMENVHCVCNSVLKPCARPNKDRCPRDAADKAACHGAFPDGMYYPVYGAPASSASKPRSFALLVFSCVTLGVLSVLSVYP